MRLRILNPTNFLILFLIRTLRCDNTPCDFNTMCLCWLQDDSDFMKMDINCMGVAFAKFPGKVLNKYLGEFIYFSCDLIHE